MLKEDYIMRIIHEVVRTLLKLLFGIDKERTEEVTFADAKMQELDERLRQMAKEGKINEAENLLWEQLDSGNADRPEGGNTGQPEGGNTGQPGGSGMEWFQLAVLFYDFLNTFTDEELEQADYSREEISQGLLAAAKQYGYDGMASALF